MTIKHMAIAVFALPLFQVKAQQLTYTPDIVLGHRSYTYLHNVSYQFNDKLKSIISPCSIQNIPKTGKIYFYQKYSIL